MLHLGKKTRVTRTHRATERLSPKANFLPRSEKSHCILVFWGVFILSLVDTPSKIKNKKLQKVRRRFCQWITSHAFMQKVKQKHQHRGLLSQWGGGGGCWNTSPAGCTWEPALKICGKNYLSFGNTDEPWLFSVEGGGKTAEAVERKCPASISPSVRGEDRSLPWLISRLIWQDMFDLIKAYWEKPGAWH